MRVRITFISAGAPRHGRNLQLQCQKISDSSGWGWDTRFVEWDYKSGGRGYPELDTELDDNDILWSVGCPGNLFIWAYQELDPSIRMVAQWIGTDVLQHQEMLRSGIQEPFSRAVHVADAPHLVQEVAELIQGPIGYVRSIPPAPVLPSPIRGWDHVVCYVPVDREDFFRYPWIHEVAGDFPNVVFEVLRPGIGVQTKEGNVNEHPELGRDDTLALLASSFVFLRPVIHDGISLTLIEAAQMGRHFIHSDTKIPHAIPGRSVGEIEFQLDTLLEKKQPPSPEIQQFYRQEYSVDALRKDLDGLRKREGW